MIKKVLEERKRLKQKYKRGFTLIELLAVIVILAIILIITIPNVLTSVNNAKKKSFASVSAIFKDSIKDYMEYASLGIGNGNNPALASLCGDDGSNCKGKMNKFNDEIIQSFGYSTDDIDADGSYFTIDGENNVSVYLKPNQNGKFVVIGNSDEYYLLTDAIFTKAMRSADNCLSVDEKSLSTTSENSKEIGLYQSSNTTNGNPTYYYRGAVDNNYVSFGTDNGKPILWRIIRINENGTIRLISELGVMNKPINTSYADFSNMYYSNGNSEGEAYYELGTLDTLTEKWYKNNLSRYESKIAQSTYCEAARVTAITNDVNGDAEMQLYDKYKPTFKCATDGNGKGVISSKVGLITYDEVVYAGGYFEQENGAFYLFNDDTKFWTMSPAGFEPSKSFVWFVESENGAVVFDKVDNDFALRPVISLNSNTLVTGEGTIDNPYVVK